MLEQITGLLHFVGAKMLTWRGKAFCDGHWEGAQLKTKADQESHRLISEGLFKLAPYPCISEEDVDSHINERPSIYWLIDPIDGTASFCGGFDGFVTQVALMQDGRPILAVVHAPALSLTYTATEHGPALCNNTSIETAACADSAIILIDNYPEPRGFTQSLYKGMGCSGYVESGSLGLKICRVADGTADLFVKDVMIRDWDLAPADLILARSGGELTTLEGDPIPYNGGFKRKGLIAAANSTLAKSVCTWVRQNHTSICRDDGNFTPVMRSP